ncbi:uncharacterized protein LOC129342904 [Eublepharis macularius]|uniref:Uncharacterized protein LOC129328032 n=1 Tax=Eublepharis macularius TaxID=481883 RepID=A0AA97J893_EUBMA|nr:uncharacterized protein LOC129328032 [Eublepharis macularius]XP_054853211.1 uncharacterized protein LOC129341876 [Eublepharis macularius]XP_054854838.1 uncharacterized protein LOC129342904 [Eublepharis macularius]
MAQVVILLLQNTVTLCHAHLRHILRRRRAAQLIFHSERLGAASRRSTLRGIRLRQRWYVLADTREHRDCWVYPRSQDWWERIALRVWDDTHWIQCFRMTRGTFNELVDALGPTLARQSTNMREPVSVEKRVAVTLWCLATGACYRVAADHFGLGLSTVSDAVLEVCFAIEKQLLSKIVCLGDEVGKIMDGFAALGFPHCVGAIDGTHIRIGQPRGKPDQYGNRKNYSSILLQGTVDHTGRFVDAEVGWSGKNHDAFVFRNSALCAAMDNGAFVPGNPSLTVNGVSVPPLMISDGAYPMRRWLMKPYGKFAVTPQQKYFDRCLARARNRVECSFGRLKGRWQCLLHRLKAREENVVTIVTACVILHNLCEAKGHEVLGSLTDPTPLTMPGDGLEYGENDRGMLDEGKRVRDAMAEFMYSRCGR